MRKRNRMPAIDLHSTKVKHAKHIVKWSLIHASMVLFFAEVVATFWPAFGAVWNGPIERGGVAIAAFFTCVAEYLYDDEELKRHMKEEVPLAGE